MDTPLRVTYETPSQVICEHMRRQILSITPEEGARVVGVGSCEKKDAI